VSRVIAVANQKGGVGKTTTTANLGAGLVERGRRVLLVDLDPQASLTLALGLSAEDLPATVYSLLLDGLEGRESQPDGLVCGTAAGPDLLPANIELSQAEIDLTREPLGIFVLRDCLAPLAAAYDYVLLDCPPSLGILTASALAAAGEIIIPLQADYLALKGVELLLGTIGKMQRRANAELKVRGILLTMADMRTLHAREVMEAARAAFGDRVPIFEAVVQASVRLKEAPVIGQSVLAYAGSSQAAQAYRALAAEIDS
jgi:chromosome partitioning protein